MRDLGSIPGLRRSLGEGRGYPLQYSGLEYSRLYSPWGRKELDMTDQHSLSLFMESRKMVLMNLSVEQQQRNRCRELVDTGVGEETGYALREWN